MSKFKNRRALTMLLGLCLTAVCSQVNAGDDTAVRNSANAADDIVDVANKAGTFKTLLAAAEAAGLVDALKGDGPLTVFAPTDEAFAKLPEHTLTDLLKPENKDKLAAILKYHVVSGKLPAQYAVQIGSAGTLAGDNIDQRVTISIRDGSVYVNNANLIVNDVKASNGIIHVIDTVLLPPEKPKKPASGFKAGADVELLPRISPDFEHDFKSKSHGKKVSVSFCNLSSKPMLVFWLQPDGKRKQWRGQIAPGKLDVCEKTFENHVWLIADEHGKPLGLYIVGDQNGIIVNTQ